MTKLLGLVQFALIFLSIGYFIHYMEDTWRRLRTEQEYENAFAMHNRININQQRKEPDSDLYIPLPPTLQHSVKLLYLCKRHKPSIVQDVWAQSSGEYEPNVEVILMRFRRIRVPKEVIRVQAIRCGTKYALIGAEDHSSGYVLTEGSYNRSTVYHIHLKFQHESNSSEDAEIPILQDVKVDKAD